MTIECYEAGCLFHRCHRIPDDGPFCDEEDCQFSNANMTEKAKGGDATDGKGNGTFVLPNGRLVPFVGD